MAINFQRGVEEPEEIDVDQEIADYLSDLPLEIGTEEAGVIIHNQPGVTREGVEVEEDFWVEIYGDEVHVSIEGEE